MQYADAQDVTQNILAAVSRAMRTFDYDINRGRFRGWLGLIANQQLNRFQVIEQAHRPSVTVNFSGKAASFRIAVLPEVRGILRNAPGFRSPDR
ncbi:MAG: hypothetical protein FJ295_15700 [Planctomycetes bacterium]|nr:hypothetical protein [Planctomycetota bacterium]